MPWSCHKRWNVFPIPSLEDEVQTLLYSKILSKFFSSFRCKLFLLNFYQVPCTHILWNAVHFFLGIHVSALIFAPSLLKISTHPSESNSFITISESSSPILPGRMNYHGVFVCTSGMIPIMSYQSLRSFHLYFTTRLLLFLLNTHFSPYPDLENHKFKDKWIGTLEADQLLK